MENYYTRLGIHPTASSSSIKSAFRKLAKKYHPDIVRPGEVAGQGLRSANLAMHLLLEAYLVLSNSKRRLAYDKELKKNSIQEGFNYCQFLQSRPRDLASQIKLLVYNLTHGYLDEAVSVYERCKTFPGFTLEKYLPRPQAMDTQFWLAEIYEKQGRMRKAYSLYLTLLSMEEEKPTFGYYAEVLINSFKRFVLQKLHTACDTEDYIDRLDEAARQNLPSLVRHSFCIKKAEILHSEGRLAEATLALHQANSIYKSKVSQELQESKKNTVANL